LVKDNCSSVKEEEQSKNSKEGLPFSKDQMIISEGQMSTVNRKRKNVKGRMTKNNCQMKKDKGKSLIDLQKMSKEKEKWKHDIL